MTALNVFIFGSVARIAFHVSHCAYDGLCARQSGGGSTTDNFHDRQLAKNCVSAQAAAAAAAADRQLRNSNTLQMALLSKPAISSQFASSHFIAASFRASSSATNGHLNLMATFCTTRAAVTQLAPHTHTRT